MTGLVESLRIEGNQPGQNGFLRDKAPGWSAYIGGLGSGKTYAAAYKLLWLHAHNECPSLAVAPTYGDLWRFSVPALVSACEALNWAYRVFPGGTGRLKVPHIMVLGMPILLMSAEHPERFAGFEVGAVWIDEAARIKTDPTNPLRDSPTQIRTRLRHPKARILAGLVSTTPEGTDTWVHRDFVEKPLPGYRFYIGKTRSNPALPPQYLTDLMASLPADLATMYLEGEAVNFCGNRAHPTFSKALHVDEKLDWLPNLPAHLGADYNVSPMCWIIGQQVGEAFHVLDEVVLPDFGQIDMAMHAADAKGWAKQKAKDGTLTPRPVHLHPDKSAKNRSTVGDPEFTVMTQTAREMKWQWSGHAAGVNPPVTARINLVSRMLLSAAGVRTLKIHPRCTTLIENFERTARLTSGEYDPGKLGKWGHILDALGYLLWDLFRPSGKAGDVSY